MPGVLKPGALKYNSANAARHGFGSHKYKPMPVGLDGTPLAHGSVASFTNQWDQMFGSLESLRGQGGDVTSIFIQGQRRRINLVAILINIVMPWTLFTAVYMMLSFEFHYEHPQLLWPILCACFCLVLLVGSLSYRASTKHRTPMWWTFATVSCSIAFGLATILGNLNYQYYLLPSYSVNNLNTYPNVDVSKDSGTQLMDLGKAYFIEGTHLDFQKSTGFKNDDMYCVAPITKGDGILSQYDFWAVGINCCSGTAADFRCGEFNNPKARSGMRLISDEQRPFYRLAVQEAAATHHINTAHPIFVEWVQDPVAVLEANAEQGWRFFLWGSSMFFGVNTVAVGLAIVGFSKLGHYPMVENF
jgi:hypothetical protein